MRERDFVAFGSARLPMIPNGFLTHPNGSPNGSNFHKYLIRRKVYGLTGNLPPGSPTQAVTPLLTLTRTPNPTLHPHASRKSNQVQPSPTKSDLIQPNQPPPITPVLHHSITPIQTRSVISRRLIRFDSDCFSNQSPVSLPWAWND
jgi:hypothetical protein